MRLPMPRPSRRTWPLRLWLSIVFLAALGISAINPPFPQDFVIEHILTVAALIGLFIAERRGGPLTNRAYVPIFIFMLLHVLGARYTYSRVPYDEWCRTLLGRDLSSMLGSASFDESGQPRNHFDRLVHFSFGLLLLVAAAELMDRWMHVRRVRRVIVALGFLCAVGTLYELAEWLYAEIAGKEAAEHYNGQQGDAFDAHKDMAMNLLGSVVAAGLMAVAAKWPKRFGSRSASARLTAI